MASPGADVAGVRALTVRDERGRALLDDVTFTIDLPARVAVMGANGAGKSVLLSALAGVVSGSGEIDLPTPRAAVLQDPEGVFATHSVFEEVAFALAALGVDERTERARVSAVLTSLGLDTLAERDPTTLSGGEQQRVHLAAALVTVPASLLLDEPREYLDEETGAALARTIASLRPAPALIAVATHDVAEALASDHVLLLGEGRVVASGPPDEVLRRPDLERWGVAVPAPLVLSRALEARGLLSAPLPMRFDHLEGRVPAAERM